MTSHSDVMNHLAEKHEKQQIVVTSEFDRLGNIEDNVILGSFSWYFMQQKRKEILRRFALQFPETTCTPSEISRAWLELTYPRQRAFKEQIREFKRARSAPLFAKPSTFDEGVYIDIRSAYWQLLQIVGWDVDYNPRKWLGRGRPMDDYPYADIKLSRNCLVTSGLPSESTFWHGKSKTFKSIRTQNRTLNMAVWAIIMDILHGVAWDAIAAGAVYAHTDGYICDRQRVDSVQSAIRGWGLESRIKAAGKTQVYGVGSYSIGDKTTKTPRIQEHSYDGLLLPDWNEWLRRKVSFFAERTNFVWVSSFRQVK